jgi:hypothetical protein
MARGTRGCVEKVTPAKIAAAKRRQKALEMKRTGATSQSIANALGYRNRSSSADAVTCALRDTVSKETANEIRLIELAWLDPASTVEPWTACPSPATSSPPSARSRGSAFEWSTAASCRRPTAAGCRHGRASGGTSKAAGGVWRHASTRRR